VEEDIHNTTWPNWVDLIVLTLVLRAAYVGSCRGFIVESLHLVGLVSITALACNFYGVVAEWVSPWWGGDPSVLSFLCFVALLLGSAFLINRLAIKVTRFIKHAPDRWVVHGLGFLVGGIRGFWWASLIVLLMLSLGMPYLTRSIEERSIAGPHVAKFGGKSLDWVADRYPGAMRRGELIPAIKFK